MQISKHLVVPVYLMLGFSPAALANLSSTVTLSSNYLFNGITLTQDDAALQPSLDWVSDSGWYLGTWGSNVSFVENTDREIDFYTGYYSDLGNNWALDLGIAHYSYYGSSYSSAFDYPEAYIKVSYGDTKLSYWYAKDYFGAGGGHYIVMLTQTVQLSEGLTLTLSGDRSTSTDTTKFMRDNDGTYHHWRVALSSEWFGAKWTAAFDDTDLELDDLGEATFSLSVAKTFNWL
jgi:uncharacterized protein (TIGR02001 family)